MSGYHEEDDYHRFILKGLPGKGSIEKIQKIQDWAEEHYRRQMHGMKDCQEGGKHMGREETEQHCRQCLYCIADCNGMRAQGQHLQDGPICERTGEPVSFDQLCCEFFDWSYI